MPIATILGIAGSALTAQSQRITLIAQNLANVDSVQSPDG
ncbi:MAG: flagellar basal body protein, partial [Stellaceae bacterium]